MTTARFIDYNDEKIALFLARPNRRTLPKVGLAFPDDVAGHPISKRESRRTFAKSARYNAEFFFTLRTAQEVSEFRIWLNQLKTQTVAIPLDTDACRLTAAINAGAVNLPIHNHPIRSGAEWLIVSADRSLYEIVTATAVTGSSVTLAGGTANAWPAGTLVFPLLFGRLTERPELNAITPSRAEFTLKVKENSPFARRLNQYPQTISTVGSQVPNLAALPLWTLQPVWSEITDSSEIDAVFEEIGFTREDAESDYGRPIARLLNAKFICTSRDQMAYVENFFANRIGRVSTFAIPTFRNDLVLAADLPISPANHVTIALGEYSAAGRTAHPGDPYIAFVETTGPKLECAIDPHKVSDVSGTDLTLVANVVQPHGKARSRISNLMLVRLVDPSLEWEYIDNTRAHCSLKFFELPDEYANPSPVLAEPVFLYQFTEKSKFPTVWRFTSYEEEFVVASGAYAGTFTPANFSHGSLRRSLKLDEQELELKSGRFTGNPLLKFFPMSLEGPLRLVILEANAADPSQAPRVRFAGEVTEPTPELDSAKCIPFGKLFSRKIPRFIISNIDNFSVDDAPLGINLSSYSNAGTIAAINGNVIDVTSSGANARGVDFFKNGWVELGTDAATWETRAVFDVALITGGIRLTLDRPLLKNGLTAVITVFPGYSGEIDELDAKFNDRISFGGHPYVPDTSPSVKAVKTKSSSGAKK